MMTGVLAAEDAALIRRCAADSERTGMLAAPVQELIHQRGWLRMFAPESMGGAELALPQGVRLEEALSAADGSTGWTVTLCAGAGWFTGFLSPELARGIVATPRVCLGGSGAPSGYADIDGDGYRLSGRWNFATGAPMTTHFTMNAVIRQDGAPLLDEAGKPRIRAFVVPAAQVRIEENWHAIGLVATASHTFSLDKVRVDASHAFDLVPGAAKEAGPLYHFPFMSLAFVTLAANISGMALNFIGQAREIIGRRHHHITQQPLAELPQVQQALARGPRELDEARTRFYQLLDAAWDQSCRGEHPGAAADHELQRASLDMVDTARRAVDELYPLCGLAAADRRCDSDIARAWRDLHTATQHALMLPFSA
ncbi:acyl-CoA dehydrogenase family protein [Massilia terrae]|uniref:Acyl-CoA dehydrogenase n=1 Tax=Massilia terrae TaxID=1811224 RepID=A0ABT2CTJ2_9BURK|nr:acyl-CoA dehydrogenase [Massilia terrae]MCS0657303.1 acyl-CoA dehydrogenase [Massilia terrae]